ncbi:MAG: ATP-binding protein [Lachnospiraceae bacterium]|nr:ATP-binding protein [Lachnospiraceae bacterium]
MGTYLNSGNQNFINSINSDIFVDKTSMIGYINKLINTNQRYISVSRPRRFGKTMAVDMLNAYYSAGSSRELFEDKKIASFEKWDVYLNRFDVIKVVMTRFIKDHISVEDSLEKLQKMVTREICKAYPDVDYYDKNDLIQTLDDVYAEEKKQFIIIIDEWDAVFRVRKDDKAGQERYLDFLRDWFKDKEYVALAYMTGILPIKKYGKHSALNMFFEYSMISPMQFAEFTGFTEDEVTDLCKKYNRDFEEIKKWYNGYEVNGLKDFNNDRDLCKYSIYSPLSVVNAITNGYIKNYWNDTETYEALAEYIRINKDGLKDTVALMMDGVKVKIDTSGYQNDMMTFTNKDDILTLLIHLGYLAYDDLKKEVFIPNNEVMDEFRVSTKSNEWLDTFENFKISQELLKATWACDENRVAQLIEDAHDKTDNKNYNNEVALSYTVQYAYYAAQKYYTTIQELDTGKGYADLAFLPAPQYADKPALIIELKYGKSALEAIDQIKQKNYVDRYYHYKGNIILIGINYDNTLSSKNKEYKRHSCIIEKN